jgi:hypothetical protein
LNSCDLGCSFRRGIGNSPCSALVFWVLDELQNREKEAPPFLALLEGGPSEAAGLTCQSLNNRTLCVQGANVQLSCGTTNAWHLRRFRRPPLRGQ